MEYILQKISYLAGSYSGAFLFYWVLIALATVGLRVLEFKNECLSLRLEKIIYWIFGLILIIFAAIRPIGISRDDLGHIGYFERICPTLMCGEWLQGGRDFGWNSLVGILKSFYPESRVMLILSAIALLAKLSVFYVIVKRPLLVLLLYFSIYYQLQDLTSWRVGFALAVLMLLILMIIKTQNYKFGWLLFTCGIFHKQAYLAPSIMIGNHFSEKKSQLCIIIAAFVLMAGIGFYPDFKYFFSFLDNIYSGITGKFGLTPYFESKNNGVYENWRNVPIVIYAQIVLVSWLLINIIFENQTLKSILSGCLIMACFSLWCFASIPDMQVRIYEFFMVPTVLLAGIKRLSGVEYIGLIFTSGIFVVKYNIVHQLIV